MDREEKQRRSKSLQDRNDYLDMFIERHKKNEQIIPELQKIKDNTLLQKGIIDDLPEEYQDNIPVNNNRNLETENEYLKTILPIPDEIDIRNIHSFTAISTSTSTDCYAIISHVGSINSEKAQIYYSHYQKSYEELQERQNRIKNVRSLLNRLNDATLIERFERAYKSFYAFKSETGTRTAAAGEIRTLLDGIKGVLMKNARRSEREDINWEQLSLRLAKNGPDSIEYHNLVAQENVRSALIDDLSIVLKDREGLSLKNLENIWIASLDHIFTVLSLVNI